MSKNPQILWQRITTQQQTKFKMAIAYGIIHEQLLSNFSSRVHFDISQVIGGNERDIKLNTRREIPCLKESMYYFVY